MIWTMLYRERKVIKETSSYSLQVDLPNEILHAHQKMVPCDWGRNIAETDNEFV